MPVCSGKLDRLPQVKHRTLFQITGTKLKKQFQGGDKLHPQASCVTVRAVLIRPAFLTVLLSMMAACARKGV